MGGNAFPHLSTPRMPPTVYQHVKSQLMTALRPHFKHADTPIEGPAKKDHGDIDIFVCDAFDEKIMRDTEALAEVVGAKEWKRIGNGGVINFALVWPEEEDVDEAVDVPRIDDLSHDSKRLRTSTDSSSISIEPSTNTLNAKLDSDSSLSPRNPKKPQKYIQLDLTIIPTYKLYTWQLFHHSHSDLWPILGSLLRRYGLSARPSGFYINIPEIEGMNRNLSLVKITEEPKEVLAYLGLDEGVYWKKGGFESWDGLCVYVGSMRFADLGRWKRKEEHERLEREENAKVKAGETVTNEAAADENASGSSLRDPPQDEDNAGGLNNNDRRRLNSRPLFSYYHSTYVPSHSTLSTPPGSSAHLSKFEIVDDVKSFFGQDFARRYDEGRKRGIKEVLEVKLWVDVKNLIKGEGATGGELGYGVKGVRSMLGEGDGDAWAWVDDGKETGSRNDSAGVRARSGALVDADTDTDVRFGTGLESIAPNGLSVDTLALDDGKSTPNVDFTSSNAIIDNTGDKTDTNTTLSKSNTSANPPVPSPTTRPNPHPHLSTTEITSLRHARATIRDLKYNEVLNWVKENWKRAGEIERGVDEAKSAVKIQGNMRMEKEREVVKIEDKIEDH